MKKLLIALMFVVASNVYAGTPADTTRVDNARITNVIEHKTTNSKGAPTVKYFFLYNGELVSTSKAVVEKYNLAKRYNAKCRLILIKRGTNYRIALG